MNPAKYSALIMAAGTGGHIMPGLAIADELKHRQYAVQWLGTSHGMENKLVPAAGLVLNTVQFSGLRGKGTLGFVKGAWQLCGALLDAVRILRRVKPNIVVGMGGYVCVPGAWAARLLGMPLVLVNADAQVLLSNRSLAGFAKIICCGFDGQAAQLPKALVTGNPIRAAVAAIAAPEQRYAKQHSGLKILVVGGSLGAQVLNTTVPAALALLPAGAQKPLHIHHQTGTAQVAQVKAAYAARQLSAQVSAFIDDMAQAYAWADVVICRAGAITVSELCAAGVPAILVPFLASTTHHQAGNAQYLADAGAGIHLAQAQLTAESLAAIIQTLSADRLLSLASAAKALGKPRATQAVVDAIESILSSPTSPPMPSAKT
jgi:UDP-N-acetylglucosamine--N-acetylmuramyl-(pentapeptide) pyrophosphoryl-undecaprenol N-acetylglucosamine transferase